LNLCTGFENHKEVFYKKFVTQSVGLIDRTVIHVRRNVRNGL